MTLRAETSNVQIKLEKLPPLRELSREWLALEAQARPSIFNSWSWIGTWLATLPGEYAPRLLRFQTSGSTVGLAVLCRSDMWRRGVIHSTCFNLNVSGNREHDCLTVEHNGFVAARSHAGPLNHALVRWFATELVDVDELYLPGITWAIEEDALNSCNLLSEITSVPYYVVELDRLRGSRTDPMEHVSSNSRQQLRRSIRYWEKKGALCIREAQTAEEALHFFASMKRLHVASWQRRGKSHSFANPYFERFHLALIESAFSAGAIELLQITAGDIALGYLYNLRCRNRTYAYQSGFVEDVRGRPGYVSHYLAIQHALNCGSQVYDFLAGRNRLKESLSTTQGQMFWTRFQKSRLRFRALHAARWLKNHLSQLG